MSMTSAIIIIIVLCVLQVSVDNDVFRAEIIDNHDYSRIKVQCMYLCTCTKSGQRPCTIVQGIL